MISQEMNLKEQIHHHLFSDIVNGVYTPGSILHEKNLMEKYGVSRAPIREALIQLCSEGVLRNLPKRGYEVTEISAEEIQNIIRYRISLAAVRRLYRRCPYRKAGTAQPEPPAAPGRGPDCPGTLAGQHLLPPAFILQLPE